MGPPALSESVISVLIAARLLDFSNKEILPRGYYPFIIKLISTWLFKCRQIPLASILGIRTFHEKGQFFLKFPCYIITLRPGRLPEDWVHFLRQQPFPSRQEMSGSSQERLGRAASTQSEDLAVWCQDRIGHALNTPAI